MQSLVQQTSSSRARLGASHVFGAFKVSEFYKRDPTAVPQETRTPSGIWQIMCVRICLTERRQVDVPVQAFMNLVRLLTNAHIRDFSSYKSHNSDLLDAKRNIYNFYGPRDTKDSS